MLSIKERQQTTYYQEFKETNTFKKQLKTSCSAIVAIGLSLTAGLAISALSALIFAPKHIYSNMRIKSKNYFNKIMSEEVYPKRSMIFHEIRQKELSSKRFSRKASEYNIDLASEIAEKNQLSEFKKFEKSQVLKYTIISGIKYTCYGVVALPFYYVGLTAFGVYLIGKKIFRFCENRI